MGVDSLTSCMFVSGNPLPPNPHTPTRVCLLAFSPFCHHFLLSRPQSIIPRLQCTDARVGREDIRQSSSGPAYQPPQPMLAPCSPCTPLWPQSTHLQLIPLQDVGSRRRLCPLVKSADPSYIGVRRWLGPVCKVSLFCLPIDFLAREEVICAVVVIMGPDIGNLDWWIAWLVYSMGCVYQRRVFLSYG